MQRLILLLIPLAVSLAWAVGHKPSTPKLFRRLPSSQTGIMFNNRIQESDSVNILRFEYLYNGGGVGIGDFNNDGWQDVFFTGNQVSSRLYLSQGKTDETPLQFEDVTESAGVTTRAWCTGVTVVDLNQDGWQDIYVSVAGYDKDTTKRANLLFINQTKKKGDPVRFEEQAREYGLNDMGYSTQTAFFDYDHDGDLDAYVLTNALDRYNRNALRPKMTNGEAPSNDRLYRNMSVERAKERKSARVEVPKTLSHSFNIRCGTLSTSVAALFKNVTHEAGILTEGYGLGIAIADLNGDGWEDVYCANDFLSNDLVWVNNQDGTFTNRAAEYLKHQTHNAMGVDIADINNDLLPDIMVVDMLPNTNQRQKMMLPGYNYDRFRMDLQMGYQPQYMRNTLQLGVGKMAFSEISPLAGVDKTDWSWAPLFADFDNDGYRDLLITNGYRRDVTNLDFTAYLADLHAGGFGDMQEKNKKAYKKLMELPDVKLADFCYRNRGAEGNLAFEDVSEQWGFEAPNFSNGAAYADLDNDGDLDVLINAIDDEAFVYENGAVQGAGIAGESNGKGQVNSWLRLSLERNPAQGTRVNIYFGSHRQTAEFNPTRGYVSSVEPYLHFGLGATSVVDSVEVIWNDGTYQMLHNVKPNQLLRIAYKPTGTYQPCSVSISAFFQEIPAAELGLDYVHVESEFNDFAQTPLLPHKFSQNGPPMAVADVDGNGLDDIYVGSDFSQKSYLYFQQSNGHFKKSELPKNANQEDTGALFFDADQDGDRDLYVVSGGSHANGPSDAYQDRLYTNDGKGRLTLSSQTLPRIDVSGSCVTTCDYDHDGDLDLFRGSRLIPGQYPMPAKSFLLKNERGRFVDVTAQIAPELQTIGLVTSAVWADFDKDGLQDLALCGEWMPVTVLRGSMGQGALGKGQVIEQYTLRSKPTNQSPLPQTFGWWNTLAAADFDNDGDMDLIAGNLGLNSKFKASTEQPIELFAADFDKNGRIDPVLTYYNDDQQWIRQTRDLLTAQIPSMKRRFPNFNTYANATFKESFTEEELKGAYHLKASEFRTMYFENAGDEFKAHPLPQEAQFAPVHGILIDDFNRDGHKDALLIGNSCAAETIGGWYDASKGILLLSDRRGGFVVSKNNGLQADREAKSIARLRRKDGATLLVIGNNGNQLQVYGIK
ncbi:VCBS repeat-containing protein [Spirosoma sp. BT702]|uniref:VCBS repeat-containing protein n=1 Tax=Spirosoma profusum TaxID=2771354 RepID=A0A927AN79_9BACT|nr:VCBS repeat-containing protein [Spirosoma profusum]MBD2701294.1 VCBS repeat-containing protein [Spirosoma profusum]